MQKTDFLVSGEGAVASYNGIDLASGNGFATFYPTDTSNNQYYLSSQVVYADTGFYLNSSGALDRDFDVTFLKPITIKGLAYISIPVSDASGANSHNETVTVTIRVVRSGVETDIGTANATKTIDSANNKFKMFTFLIDCAETSLKIGDKLRLTIQLTASGGNYQVAKLWYKPTNTETTAIVLVTQSVFKLPIKLEL